MAYIVEKSTLSQQDGDLWFNDFGVVRSVATDAAGHHVTINRWSDAMR